MRQNEVVEGVYSTANCWVLTNQNDWKFPRGIFFFPVTPPPSTPCSKFSSRFSLVLASVRYNAESLWCEEFSLLNPPHQKSTSYLFFIRQSEIVWQKKERIRDNLVATYMTHIFSFMVFRKKQWWCDLRPKSFSTKCE